MLELLKNHFITTIISRTLIRHDLTSNQEPLASNTDLFKTQLEQHTILTSITDQRREPITKVHHLLGALLRVKLAHLTQLRLQRRHSRKKYPENNLPLFLIHSPRNINTDNLTVLADQPTNTPGPRPAKRTITSTTNTTRHRRRRLQPRTTLTARTPALTTTRTNPITTSTIAHAPHQLRRNLASKIRTNILRIITSIKTSKRTLKSINRTTSRQQSTLDRPTHHHRLALRLINNNASSISSRHLRTATRHRPLHRQRSHPSAHKHREQRRRAKATPITHKNARPPPKNTPHNETSTSGEYQSHSGHHSSSSEPAPLPSTAPLPMPPLRSETPSSAP